MFSNLIPGEGDTEVSIDIRDNHKPDYSILAVREIEKTETGNYFTQFSLFNTEKNNDERVVGNIGIGKRNLSDDKTLLTGFNAFLDYDDNDNTRMSLGFEARSAVLELWYNQYFGVSDGTDEKVLELFPEDKTLSRWIKMAKEQVQFQGLPSRICWLNYNQRAKFGVALNQMVANGELSAPIVIALEFMFFAEEENVSPTFPTLIVPSLQVDQLPD